MVDFSNVPAGSIIENTTGGNVARTTKTGAVLSACKQMLGGLLLQKGEFSFTAEQVDDQSGTSFTRDGISQTVTNEKDGSICFDKLGLTKEGTYWFKVFENGGTDSSIRYDNNFYLAKVVMTAYTQSVNNVVATTLIPTVVYYDQNGNALSEGSVPTFTNGPKQGTLTYTKTVKGDVTEEDLKDITFTVTDKDGNVVDTAKLGDLTRNEDGTYSKTLTVAPGEYTVTESNADVEGYNVQIEYSTADGKAMVEDQKTAEVDITDTYTKVESDNKTSNKNKNNKKGKGTENKIDKENKTDENTAKETQKTTTKDVRQNENKASFVKTGDQTPILTMVLAFMCAAILLAVTIILRRRNESNKETQ